MRDSVQLPVVPCRHGSATEPRLSHHGECVAYGHHGDLRLAGTSLSAHPDQWREFLLSHPELGHSSKFYGASPCTDDRKIHYLTGVAHNTPQSSIDGEPLTRQGGEYAVVQVDDAASLRDTWIWLLTNWLPASGRREKNAPEFERFTSISEAGLPIGPVEIWIPLEPLATD